MHPHFQSALKSSMTALAALAMCAGGSAAAQPVASAPVVFGPALPGVCILARAVALDRSLAGVSANQQIQQFTVGIRAELDAQRGAIINDDRTLAAQKASMPPADYQQRVAQLQQRYAVVDRTTRVRAAQVSKTKADAVRLILDTMTPSLGETVTARKCSVVIERGETYGANAAMDITDQVIQRMNARLQSVTLRLAPPEVADRQN
jgi:Skp family chaperone for outer membrane proteins